MMFLEKHRPQKKGKTVCIVRVAIRALNDSVYRHNCNTFSSLNEQDFLESVGGIAKAPVSRRFCSFSYSSKSTAEQQSNYYDQQPGVAEPAKQYRQHK